MPQPTSMARRSLTFSVLCPENDILYALPLQSYGIFPLKRWSSIIPELFYYTTEDPRLSMPIVTLRVICIRTTTPWIPADVETRELRLAMVTTGGVHLKTQTPFNMNDRNGDPSFRVIPRDVRKEALMITHNYYDHSDTDRDPNLQYLSA
ncbi:MAG: hypothetical protein JRG73_16315 [Deltaproteobacteria bacterium]|nr:hypothetical protein [Deltaproteobacteria bacterium]